MGEFFNLSVCSRHPTWSITDILGAIVRVVEYRFVKVPCSGDSEGDSVILVVEDFEHVGSDGSPAFGDPRYIPCNPAVKLALQRPAPHSPSKSSYTDVSIFTQSLDPSDLLFLESTCTQSLQHTLHCFPQVILDSDWRIPADQARLLDSLSLPLQPKHDFYHSDVELSDDDAADKVTIASVDSKTAVASVDRKTAVESVDRKTAVESVDRKTAVESVDTKTTTMPPTSHSPKRTQPFHVVSSFSLSSQASPSQAPQTQMPVTQQFTQMPVTQQFTQNSREAVLFPATQNSSQSHQTSSPTKKAARIEQEITSKPPSSPINSPVKSPVRSSVIGSPLRGASTATANLPEYPDYSAW
jgi:hypothetical protein